MHYNFLICVKDKPSADQATSTSNKRKSSSDKHKSSSKKQRNSEVRPISASKKTEEKKKDLAKRCVLFMLKIFYIRTTQILMIFVNVFSSFLLGDAFWCLAIKMWILLKYQITNVETEHLKVQILKHLLTVYSLTNYFTN